MAPRDWTILIVPPGTGTTRTIVVGPRAHRALLGGAVAAVLLVAFSIAVLFTPWATPSARLLLAQNTRLQARMNEMDSRLAALSDTLTSLGERDQQIRLLADLPAEPASTVTEGPVAADSATAGVGALGSLGVGAPGVGSPGAASSGIWSASGGSLGFGSLGARSLAGIASNPLPKPFLNRLRFPSHAEIDEMFRRAGELSKSFRAVSDTLTRNFERQARTPSIMPTTGWLSSQFSRSRFHPVLHQSRPHEGIDLAAPMGAPIIAPAAGRVISVTSEAGYGHTFQIDHGNGIVTRFAHCSRIVVHVGQQVTRGQLIATVGNSGLATGPHLHYEVHVNGKLVDPLSFVLPEKLTNGK